MLYRDLGDSYVANAFDFTGITSEFASHLSTAAAGGGGDTPEAPDRGFAAAQQLAWSSQSSTAKLAF